MDMPTGQVPDAGASSENLGRVEGSTRLQSCVESARHPEGSLGGALAGPSLVVAPSAAVAAGYAVNDTMLQMLWQKRQQQQGQQQQQQKKKEEEEEALEERRRRRKQQ